MALPGVKTTILDRFYNLNRTDLPGGPLVAVLAKRSFTPATPSAPSLTAFFPSGEQEVIAEFGENSNIHRAYYELTTAGAPRVVLFALHEDTVFNHANGTITSELANADATPNYSGDQLLVEAFGAIESARPDFVLLWGSGSQAEDWDETDPPASPSTPAATDFFYADNNSSITNSWAAKAAEQCAIITDNSYPCHAIMGVKGMAGKEAPSASEVSSGLALLNLMDREDATFKYGHFISVVATEVRPLSAPSPLWGWSNGASAYAAMVSRLDAWRAPTGKPVYNVDRVRYNPTRTQAEALINKGVVPVTLDYSRSPRWTDAQTFAKPTSDFIRFTTLRICFDVVKIVRRTSQGYIGEGMTSDTRNAFETQISSNLRAMQQVGAITNSDFRVRYIPSEYQAIVDIAITPAFELRTVVLNVSINF